MDTKDKIKDLIKENDVCLFMKGTPESPQCGFSMAVCNVLKHLNVKFKGVNILEDDELRQGIKDFSDWPTIPQLYVTVSRTAPTACTYTVSGSISLPSQGFFSPFPHGTGSLSVSQEYLALEDGPPIFKQDITCPALLVFTIYKLSHTGLSPTMATLSRVFC